MPLYHYCHSGRLTSSLKRTEVCDMLSFQLLVFKVLNFIGISWGIVGASLAGSHGICVDYGSTPSEEDDEEELSKCYYDVNLAANRTIAIVTVCLHVFGTIFHFILGMSEGRSSSPVRPSLAIKKTTVKLDYKKQTDQNFVNHNKGATRPTLKLASSSSSSDEDEVQFKSHDSSKGTAAPKKRVLLRRHTSVFVINADGNKEKNPQKQKSDLVPPQSLGTDRSPRGASGQRGDAQRLKNHPSSDDLLQSSRRQNSATALRQTANYVVSSFKQLKQIRSPPPSYEDAVSTDIRRKPSELQPNPYYLPPLPDQDQCNLRAPEDSHIYTGGSYPDTELVVKQPSDFR